MAALSKFTRILVSNNIFNDVSECNISYGFKTDHATVSMVINTVSTKHGPGSFKINNSILLETEYQEKVKEAIRDISNINKDANANTLWELIKGTIRNTSIKYSSEKSKKNIMHGNTNSQTK